MAKAQWKLVRDNIPEIMIEQGKTPETRILDDKAYKKALIAKLDEEVKELKQALVGDKLSHTVAEVGDVLEVLAAIGVAFELPNNVIFDTANIKRERNGAFKKRTQLKL